MGSVPRTLTLHEPSGKVLGTWIIDEMTASAQVSPRCFIRSRAPCPWRLHTLWGEARGSAIGAPVGIGRIHDALADAFFPPWGRDGR